jgi:hypothetical protein
MIDLMRALHVLLTSAFAAHIVGCSAGPEHVGFQQTEDAAPESADASDAGTDAYDGPVLIRGHFGGYCDTIADCLPFMPPDGGALEYGAFVVCITASDKHIQSEYYFAPHQCVYTCAANWYIEAGVVLDGSPLLPPYPGCPTTCIAVQETPNGDPVSPGYTTTDPPVRAYGDYLCKPGV